MYSVQHIVLLVSDATWMCNLQIEARYPAPGFSQIRKETGQASECTLQVTSQPAAYSARAVLAASATSQPNGKAGAQLQGSCYKAATPTVHLN